MTKTFSVRSERAGSVHRVVPCGELDLETVPVLESELDAVSALDPGLVIVVDLTELTLMDSTGLHLLVRLSERLPERLRVINGTSSVERRTRSAPDHLPGRRSARARAVSESSTPP